MKGRWAPFLRPDEKRRVVLPPPVRQLAMCDDGTSDWKVGRLDEDCVVLLSPRQHEAFLERLSRFPARTRGQRRAVALLQGRFSALRSDAGGRLTIPEPLFSAVGLRSGQDSVLVGLEDRVEIWSRTAYEAFEASVAASEDFSVVLDAVVGDAELPVAVAAGEPEGAESEADDAPMTD